jgi:5-(aminomethyl)-3-furanmethanol phosphate kinase
MTRTVTSVVKVGGSLFDWTEFPRRTSAFLQSLATDASAERIILIAGGGPAADVIRELDGIHQFDDETAHRLAIHAMELTAHILAALLPRTVVVCDLDSLRAVWTAGAIPILAPYLVWRAIEGSEQDLLPMTWDTTSDSIAARIAVNLAADRLILLKSAPLSPGTNREEAARLGLVDPIFPVAARALARVEYVNLREDVAPHRLLLI